MNYNFKDIGEVPSIPRIQEILVELEDKPKSFMNSRQWIGSFEVSDYDYTIDTCNLYLIVLVICLITNTILAKNMQNWQFSFKL